VAIFVDTLYWLALVNKNDHWYRQALDWSSRIEDRLVTTDAVLTEVADALCRADRRRWAVEAVEAIRADHSITSVPGGAKLFTDGFKLYAARPDKDWSLTDCMSFVVMKDRKIEQALTADIHFVQAGFRALLRE
jgi:hypothetical protein